MSTTIGHERRLRRSKKRRYYCIVNYIPTSGYWLTLPDDLLAVTYLYHYCDKHELWFTLHKDGVNKHLSVCLDFESVSRVQSLAEFLEDKINSNAGV